MPPVSSPSTPIRGTGFVPPPGLRLRQLGPADAAAHLAHLHRLPPADRTLRFCGGSLPLVSALDHEPCALMLGAIVAGELRAVGELHPLHVAVQDEGEIAFSVERGWQGQGLGRLLFARIVALARQRGFKRLLLICSAHNAKMIHLAQDQGARIVLENGEVTAQLRLATDPPPPVLRLADGTGGTTGLAALGTAASARVQAWWRSLWHPPGAAFGR